MLQHILRSNVLIVALLSCFSNSLFAVVNNENELARSFLQAQQLVDDGKLKKAISAYQSIIHAHPEIPEAYNNLASLYLQQNDTKQAKEILEQGLNAHKGYSALYKSLTSINIAMAREAYSKALQIDLKPASIAIDSLALNTRNIESIEEEIEVTDVSEPHPGQKIKAATINTTQIKLIDTTLKAWSAAWSAQAVDIYLSFYHENYKSSNGISKNDWAQSRRIRLKKPRWIKVALSDIKIIKNMGNEAVVNFKQLYQSNKFRDVTSKQMVLLYTDNGWQILSEKSL